MIWRPLHHRIFAQIADAVTTILSFFGAYGLWRLLRWLLPELPIGSEPVFHPAFSLLVAAAAPIWVILFNVQGAYSYQRFTSFAKEIKLIFKTTVFGLFILLALVFLARPGYIPRTLVIIFAVVNFVFLLIEKLFMFYAAKIIRKRGQDRKTVLVVGGGVQTKRFIETLEKNFAWGLDILGILCADCKTVGRELFGKTVLGNFDDIRTVLHENHFDEVIITISSRRMGEIQNVLEACEREGVQVRIISDFLGMIAKKIRADMIYGLAVISISYIPENNIPLLIKRAIDLTVSSLLLIILAPLFLIIALAIKFSSPGPIFYQWNVVGFNKKPFRSWKFRTMVSNADALKQKLLDLNEMQGPVFKIKNDPRVTPIGRILRKYSLDELPQLWSVLKGDMSLIGPRPAGPHELVRYKSWQRRKLSFKPGLSCLWQVNGRNNISNFDDWVKMDLEYIDNWSLWLDTKIFFKTIQVVLTGKGAS
jgi:exopolysaccharide biosynthesis polyprenyl glycosylphosphotransferase